MASIHMNTAPAYLIAKYIPDLRRMEPKNIGVILWVAGKSYCRFLTSSDAAEFVQDRAMYGRWIEFWMDQVQRGVARVPREPEVSVESPEYLAALKKTQRENYALDDGGEVLSRIRPNEGPRVVEFLFEQLIATKAEKGTDHEETFTVNADAILTKAGFLARNDFQGTKDIDCEYNGVIEPLRFHYCFGNGAPQIVLHRAKIRSSQSVNSTAWMFDRLANAHPSAKRGVIINTADAEPTERKTKAFLAILAGLATTIDIGNENGALAHLGQMA
jgi:hypothetical protein